MALHAGAARPPGPAAYRTGSPSAPAGAPPSELATQLLADERDGGAGPRNSGASPPRCGSQHPSCAVGLLQSCLTEGYNEVHIWMVEDCCSNYETMDAINKGAMTSCIQSYRNLLSCPSSCTSR